MGDFLKRLDDEMTAVVSTVRQSLVQLSNGVGHGAGTIWHPDGLILTNAHVVAGYRPRWGRRRRRSRMSDHLTVTLADGRSYAARILAADEQRDLAALAVDAGDLPTIELGNSHRLRAGDWVLAVGHPWGVG